MKKPIVLKGNSVLTQVAKEVPLKKISDSNIQTIIKDLHDTLKATRKGVGLAAPQIGSSVRIFVVAPHLFKEESFADIPQETTYINPVITWRSKDAKKMEEGCLSIPGIIGSVRRSSRATIEAYDAEGNYFTITASGLLAQIFQHETDHLDGILFDTKATNLRTLE